MSNIGATSIGRQAKSLSVGRQFNGYSRVIINVTEELYYTAGNDTGRTLEIDMPWGTQAMANNLLATIRGFQYQPYEASDAILDPAAELGDGVTVNGVYSGIFRIFQRGGVLHAADVSAPASEDINHEYKYVSKTTRKIDRQIANVESELLIQADQISAKVSQTGGSDSSFSWQLLSTGFLLKSDGNTVFSANSGGISVTGTIRALGGYIGSREQGFVIAENAIKNGKTRLDSTSEGVYLGTDGISLGANFKVDNQGNLTASSGTFTGSVYANKIESGGDAGYITGGKIGSGAITTGKCSSGINVSLGNADFSADVFSGAATANYMKANSVRVLGGQSFYVYGKQVVWSTINYKNHAGVNSTLKVLVQGGVNP